ncbi:hypothetical protein HPHPH5B_0228 [Helicobacter pylori Hp H-5b]|nr:hypothetical protein HPHPH5B_0228 [Helicobacter pylori Hp H-5b]EKE92693.1 hypothetical protein OUO_0056 [Helicobacter pylori R046Wa]
MGFIFGLLTPYHSILVFKAISFKNHRFFKIFRLQAFWFFCGND